MRYRPSRPRAEISLVRAMQNPLDMTHAITLVLGFALLACGSSSSDPPGGSSTGSGGAGGSGGQGAGGGDGGGVADPCSAELLAEPKASTTYYLAIGEAGADNDACDGLAPTDEGGGHCPFKDFSSAKTMALLTDVADVRVELRAGTYLVYGWDGLAVRGTGTSEAERVVLSAYPGEHPVLDVPSPDGAACTGADPTTNPECVRQVVRLAGQYTVVQGLTIQNGLAYDAEINGGAHHLFRCNTLQYTAEFSQRSDQLKIDGGATDVTVRANELTGWWSQAIDITEVHGLVVEENDFHDPHDADGGATGSKFGADTVVIRNNTVHDLGSDVGTHVFALGGTGSTHPDDFEAYRVQVIGNRVWNAAGILAQVTSCKDCSVEDNEAYDLGAGVLLSASGDVAPCSTAPNGTCLPSEGTLIRGNRLRRMKGGTMPDSANIFVVVEPGQGTGLVGEDNTYCAPSAANARFGWPNAANDGIEMLGFDAWVTKSGTDETSVVVAESDPACAD